MMGEKKESVTIGGNSSDSMPTVQEYGTNLTKVAQEVCITLEQCD